MSVVTREAVVVKHFDFGFPLPLRAMIGDNKENCRDKKSKTNHF